MTVALGKVFSENHQMLFTCRCISLPDGRIHNARRRHLQELTAHMKEMIVVII